MRSELALCYYPTNVALIDDDEGFLFNLQHLLKMKIPQLKCTTFSNPNTALQFTNDLHKTRRSATTRQVTFDDNMDAEAFILNTLNQSSYLRYDRSRFNEISVVVVDLDMPGIDGLEFCRKLQNPNIKKILLTGMSVDQKVIQAFNDNVIHYYLKKSDDNMEAMLEAAILRMQQQYFIDVSMNYKSEAIDNFAPLFFDSAVADYFEELCETLGVVEYYFQTNPSRYQLTLIDGQQCNLLIYTDEELESQVRILHEENAPATITRKIEARTHVPYFATTDGYYNPDFTQSMRYLYPANLIPGNRDYYCAIVGDAGTGNANYPFPLLLNGLTLH